MLYRNIRKAIALLLSALKSPNLEVLGRSDIHFTIFKDCLLKLIVPFILLMRFLSLGDAEDLYLAKN